MSFVYKQVPMIVNVIVSKYAFIIFIAMIVVLCRQRQSYNAAVKYCILIPPA